VDVSSAAFKAFTRAVSQYFARGHAGEVALVGTVIAAIQATGVDVSTADARRYLRALVRQNRVMISNGIVYAV
jgi:hypothetical protein